MRKTLLYAGLLLTAMANAQSLNIPDPNFKAALLAANTENGIARDIDQNFIVVDTNNNGEIEAGEANNVYHLLIGNYGISSVAGVEDFSNLETLDCSMNNITSIDVNGLPNLRNLSAGSNALTSVNITGLAELEWLYVNNNNLAALNLTGCTSLRILDCGYNSLTTLELSDQQESLENITCNDNALIGLDFNGFAHLDYIFCEYNQLAYLDLEDCPLLYHVATSYNNITSLDVSDCPLLEILDCDNNQIEVLIIKNNADNSDSFYDFWGNPLHYLCVDEIEAEGYVEILEFYEYDNVAMNTYCTFTPGGSYNTISGTFSFDADNNGCDASDSPQAFVKVVLDNGSQTGTTFTNAAGNYSFYTFDGNFTLTPEFENDWFTVSPATAEVSFEEANSLTETRDFCITANGVHPDAEVVVFPIEPAQPGFDAIYEVVFRNKGNQVLSGSVTLTFPDEVVDYVSAAPAEYSVSGGTVVWNYANLMPYENKKITVTLNVNAPTEIPAVNIDDVLVLDATVATDVTDETPEDNTFAYNEVVVGSFDPNVITCLEGATASPEALGEYLHYVVQFENTGTAPATFIVVEQEINPADFDVNTLQILSASHNMNVMVEGNKIVFYFADINLGPLEHGNILFKMKNNAANIGDEVMGQANIFFDYNFPIETNEANTVFQTLSRGDFAIDDTIMVYPNPSAGLVKITSGSTLAALELYDLQGRLLQKTVNDKPFAQIDLSNRAVGMYFLKVYTDRGMKIEKIIKK